MSRRLLRFIVVFVIAATAMALPVFNVSGQMPVRAPRYAITNARIVTMAGAPIEKGTLLMRDGVIEEVGSSVRRRPTPSWLMAAGSLSIPA